MSDISALKFLPFKQVVTHHSPGSISYLGVFLEALNNYFDEVIIIVITCTKQNLADDVRGRIMKHNLRAQSFTCARCNNHTSLAQHSLIHIILTEHYVIKF